MADVKKILYLVHRIPYPPNKGDKIRSYHFLKYLAEHHEVYLGAFVDDPGDFAHANALSDLASSVFLCPLNRRTARIRSARGLVSREALSVPYYRDKRMQLWVDEILEQQDIHAVVCFSSVMCQYVLGEQYRNLIRISDFVDIDSDKWRQYASSMGFPLNYVYRREARRLFDFERHVATVFDRSLFVSAQEANLFREYAPECSDRISHFNNGVDTEYFTPGKGGETPYAAGDANIVFTGAMDYWANIDAVCWFANEILPLIRKRVNKATFHIVGINPAERVKLLERLDGVKVVGAVADMRPYLAHADLVVAPLRIARGIQNKVLEAMAMARPVVLTPAAMEGIEHTPLLASVCSDRADRFASHCIDVLESDEKREPLRSARDFVITHYNWDRNLSCIDEMLAGPASGHNV